MRKQNSLKLLLCIFLLGCLGVTRAWGDTTHSGTFTKITSANDLTTGYYVITASSSATSSGYALGSEANTNKRIAGVSITISNGTISNPSTAIVYYVTKSTNGYSFKNESTSKYLYQSATSSGRGMAFSSDEYNFTLSGYNSSSPTGFKFTLNGASNNIFKYNNSSTWFANYSGDYSTSMTPVDLYKLGSSQTTVTLSAGDNGSLEAYSANTYNSDVKLTPSDNKVSVSSGSTVYLKAVPNNGYIVDGWSDNVTVDEDDNTKASIGSTGTAEVSFKVNTFTVTLDKGSYATADGSFTIDYLATSKTSLTAPTSVMDGYEIDGYYTSAEGTTKVINADGSLVSGVSDWTDANGKWINYSTSQKLYTHYKTSTKTPYTVTFNKGTGTCSTTSLTETSAGAGVELPTPTTTDDDWSFYGWSESNVSEETSSEPTLVTTTEDRYYLRTRRTRMPSYTSPIAMI